jgi:hypothetical protein
VGINIPDQKVYAPTPDGTIDVISSGVAGLSNPSAALGVHIPVQFHPVAQFAPGYTSSELTTAFTIGTSLATLQTISVFALGRLWYIAGPMTCPKAASGAYQLAFNTGTKAATLSGLTSPLPANSGTINPLTNDVTLVFMSESVNIQSWFYIPQWQAADTAGNVPIFRVSNVQTFGAIPVSTGFPGAAAATYWGHP